MSGVQGKLMQRKTGDIKCWNCHKWINKKGNLCPYCGKSKEQSRKLVEAKEDKFFSMSAVWLVAALLLAVVPWAIVGSPIAFCGAGLLLFFPRVVFSYLWAGMAGG